MTNRLIEQSAWRKGERLTRQCLRIINYIMVGVLRVGSTICSVHKTHFVTRVILKSRNEGISRCILEIKMALSVVIHSWVYIKYEPEMTFQSHRDQRIKRKAGRKVERTEQDILQPGRETRRRASDE